MLQFLRELIFNVVELGGGEGGDVDCFFLSTVDFVGMVWVILGGGRGGNDGGMIGELTCLGLGLGG